MAPRKLKAVAQPTLALPEAPPPPGTKAKSTIADRRMHTFMHIAGGERTCFLGCGWSNTYSDEIPESDFRERAACMGRFWKDLKPGVAATKA